MEAIITRREQEIYNLILEGLTNKQIAEKLGVAVGTINGVVGNIYLKCNLTGNTSYKRTSLIVNARDGELTTITMDKRST